MGRVSQREGRGDAIGNHLSMIQQIAKAHNLTAQK